MKRIGPEYNDLCHFKSIQTALKRILLIWHMRHPQSGYVQGMCDIAIPFLIVFLTEVLPITNNFKICSDAIDNLPSNTLE